MSEESDEPDYSSFSPDDVKVLREIYGLKDRNDLPTMSESSLSPKFWRRGEPLSNGLDDPMTPPQLSVKDNELVDIAPYGNDVNPYGTDDSEETAYIAYQEPFEQNERLLSKENEKAALIGYLLSRVHGRRR
ncbi:hypothetical protein MAR_035070 [Mya arenaria]|uniref:Uncharacterized protein n=2 Tax=Mya arenaria TaxID=6604 RepID=A0ABY7ENM8_MYAAR|nr:hypothetical protein MAR_035070 [Mya arenaria]